MEQFTTHTGVGVPLRRSNVDTDQIIPAVYLKRVTRTGFEDGLFAAWRNDPDFVLNNPTYAGGLGARRRSRLRHRLVARARRVGAAELRLQGRHLLALRRHLPRQLRQGRAARGAGRREGRPAAVGLPRATTRAATVTVDLESRTVRAGEGPDAIEDSFDIDDYTRWRLLEGLDDIGITLGHDDDIAAFETRRPSWKPATKA